MTRQYKYNWIAKGYEITEFSDVTVYSRFRNGSLVLIHVHAHTNNLILADYKVTEIPQFNGAIVPSERIALSPGVEYVRHQRRGQYGFFGANQWIDGTPIF